MVIMLKTYKVRVWKGERCGLGTVNQVILEKTRARRVARHGIANRVCDVFDNEENLLETHFESKESVCIQLKRHAT